jgi:hypothetical protein
MGGERAPQLGLDRGRGAQRDDLTRTGGNGPGGHHGKQDGEGGPQGGGPRAAGRAGQGMREQARLRQHEGGDHQAKADGEDQIAPGGPGVAQQPGIAGPHTGGFGAKISEMTENTRMTPPMLMRPLRAARSLE